MARYAQLRPYLEDGVPLTRVAQDAGIPLRTAQRWRQRYQQHGLPGLVRQTRQDAGTRQLSAELQQIIEGLALRRPPPSIATIHRRVVDLAPQQGWDPPSYSTVYAIVRALDPGLRMLAHEGAKAYQEAFDLLYRREATRPNELWQADHTPLDLWVRDLQGRPARPWLTVVLDDYSRAVAGYRVGLEAPSALRTSLVLRQAIWRKEVPHWPVCGIPETFYTDHGSDFTSTHLEQVAADLKMGVVFSTIGKPRGRGKIERFFESVNQLFLCTLPGYTAPGSAPPKQPTLTLAELQAQLGRFLLETYHQRVHRETGMTPQDRWTQGAFLPRLPESLEQLDLLLLTVAKARQIQQDGIHFQGLRYLDLTLAAYVGESVVIRYDPADLAEIRVYYQNCFLCRAVCQELAGTTISLPEIVQARNARRRSLQGDLKYRAHLVEEVLADREAPSAPPPPSSPPASSLKRYWNE